MAAATKTSAKSAPAAKTATPRPKGYRGAEQRFHKARRASILLKHVSDPTRLQVILILAEGERHVGACAPSSARASPRSATTSPCSATAGSSPLAARARTTSTASPRPARSWPALSTT